MSQQNPKYKRLEALLSDSRPVDPDPVPRSRPAELDQLKARLAQLESELEENRRNRQDPSDFRGSHPGPDLPGPGLEAMPQPDSSASLHPLTRSDGPPDSRPDKDQATLLKKIHRFFTPPEFPEDEGKSRRASLLHVILVAESYVLLSVLAGTLITMITQGTRAASDMIVMGIGLSLILLWRFLMRRGQVGIASTGMILFFLASVTMILVSGGTIRSPGVVYFPLTVVMATLLINRRAGIVFFVLTSLIGIGLVEGELYGLLPTPGNTTSFASNVIVISGLGLAMVLLFLATRGTEEALERARRNEQAVRLLASNLELRVADRTHDLELASEVGRTITARVSNVFEMLSEATEMIRSRFGLYYTQVYLLEPSGRTIILRAGTGEVGRQLLDRGHQLSVNSGSLNGRAVSEKRPVIVADTAKDAGFLPNPLLPNTRSEMVVPLMVGGRVLGVLDMQSEAAQGLNRSNLPAFETLAAQLSVAIQNATLFGQSEDARKQVEANVRQFTQGGWQDFLNAVERGEKIGFTYQQGQVVPLNHANGSNPASTLNVPITVTGAHVGTIQLVKDEQHWTAQEAEIVEAAALQLAQHIDGLRLLAQAERYRSEAEQAVRRLTREGWETFLEARRDISSGYLYDLNHVHAFETGNHNGHFESAIAKPFVVRDETIGELAVNIGNKSPEEINEIITSVAEQLGDHIENLRLSEQNEMRAAELEKAVTQLRELDRLKSSFLANMSHELRTPLNSILGFADVMLEELDGPLTQNMNNDLGLIQKNGQHLLHLINDVLDMAKIESGKMNLNPETFRIHEILEDVTSITSTLAGDKKLALEIETDSDANLEIFADRTRLRQVMINIVNNAIKFTEQGKITIRAKQAREHVLIQIKDTGIGIPPDKLEAVFQEFTQVDVSSTRKSGGTGLGLPISRRLIEMHGGRIWAESSGVTGAGSSFFVELPLQAMIAEPIEKQEK